MQPPPKGEFNAGIPIQYASGSNPQAQALNNLGRAVKGLGDLAADLEAEQERQDMADAEIIMRDAAVKVQDSLAGNFKFHKHQEIAEGIFDEAKKKIFDNENLTPKSQRQLEERIAIFTKAKLEKVGLDSKLMQVENGKRLHMAKIEMHRESGDLEMARAAFDEGVGVYYPKEVAEIGKMKLDQQEKGETLLREADSGNEEFIENAAIADSDKRRLIQRAKTAKARIVSQQMERVADLQIMGQIKTEADLVRELDNQPDLTDKDKALAVAHWKKDQPIELGIKQDIYDRLNQNHENYRLNKIPKSIYTERHHDMSKEVWAMGSREGTGPLRKKVYDLDPMNWKEGKFSTGKISEWDQYVEKLSSDTNSTGGFLKQAGEKATPTEKQASTLYRANTEDEVKKWILENQEMLLNAPNAKELITNQFQKVYAGSSSDEMTEMLKKRENLQRMRKILGRENDTGMLPDLRE